MSKHTVVMLSSSVLAYTLYAVAIAAALISLANS